MGTILINQFKPLPFLLNRAELVVYVMERPQMGPAKRVLAIDFFKALNDPKVKPQLAGSLAVENITHKVMTKDQLKQYLDNPPAGKGNIQWYNVSNSFRNELCLGDSVLSMSDS